VSSDRDLAFPESPWIISVDDHVTEPPDLWTSRLPTWYADRAPRVVRDRATFHMKAGIFSFDRGDPDGRWCDFWTYEKVMAPLPLISHAVGFEHVDNLPVTYDDVVPGCWQQRPRLEDMTRNHVEASLCFPNVLPRFCGQTFMEEDDKELGLLCVQAYNDWMIDEWCAGDGFGRLIPNTLVPLWDPRLAAVEVRRCADKGSHAIAFCENPSVLGLPSVYDSRRWWDPLFQACEDTATVVNMHIGTSSQMPSTAPDAPYVLTSILMFQNSMSSMLDFIVSGTFDRFPGLRIAYSEGQIGWLPYAIARADRVWADPHDGGHDELPPNPPSTYVPGHVYGCIFDDDTALHCRQLIGIDQIMFEVDYPHSATSFPNTRERAQLMCKAAGLTDEETYKLLRGNAIRAYGLDRFGIRD
jgi:predicted TIM-barrel fold metal-dependent hydrolase